MLLIDEFTGARSKLERANLHIAELAGLVSGLASSHPVAVIAGSDSGGWIPYSAKFDAPDTVPLSLVAADAIQNLRASLDLGASALARKNGVTSSSKLRKVYFPMGGDTANWTDLCSKLGALIGIAAQQAIEAIEAYPGGKGERLKVLSSLSNIDKHRLLLPTAPVTMADIQFGFAQGDLDGTAKKAGLKVGELMAGKRPAETGDVLFYLASDNSPATELNLKIHLSIGFDSPDVPGREWAVETLTCMAGLVKDALSAMIAA